MADSEDIEVLKRRGRRRLLGAIALVLLAVMVLPLVFDREPREPSVRVNVKIPGEDSPPLVSKTVPQAVLPKTLPAPTGLEEPPLKPVLRTPGGQGESQAGTGQERKPRPAEKEVPQSAPSAPAVAEVPREKASAPALVIPVVALASRDKVKEVTDRLAAAKLPFYTEPVSTAKGTVTRIRVGPYGGREAAERAYRKLKELGFMPGAITTRSE